MRRTSPVIWIVLAIVVIFAFWGCSGYNGLVQQDEVVKQAWGNVQSDYQRRADLIPNLVSTVKGAANFEKETYTQVALARSGQLKQAVNVPVDSLTPQRMQQIQQANDQYTSAARAAFNIVIERYPDLKATNNFTALQTQLEGTENRINVSRKDYNTAVRDYNVKVRSFPTNVFAGMFGFKQRAEFQAQANADQAPKVDF